MKKRHDTMITRYENVAKNSLMTNELLKLKDLLPKVQGPMAQSIVTSPQFEAYLYATCDPVKPDLFGNLPFLGFKIFTLIEMASYEQALVFSNDNAAIAFVTEVKGARLNGDPHKVIKKYFNDAKLGTKDAKPMFKKLAKGTEFFNRQSMLLNIYKELKL